MQSHGLRNKEYIYTSICYHWQANINDLRGARWTMAFETLILSLSASRSEANSTHHIDHE